MISLLYLLSALTLGLAVTRRLGLRLLPFEGPAFTVAIGLLLWSWLSLLWALALPYAISLPLTVITAGAATAWLWRTSPPWHWQPFPAGRGAKLAWALFTSLTALLIGWLMWTHDLVPSGGSLYSANATWADFGLHTSLISHFANAHRLPLDFPVAAGQHLTYPFITDLLSAWLVQGGWSLHLAIFIPSLLLTLAFFQLMFGFSQRLFGSLGGAVIGLSLFLLCGSAVGVFSAFSDLHAGTQSLGVFLTHLPKDYSILTTPNAQFINPIADILLPQRAFLMGFSTFGVVIVLLVTLRQRFHLGRGLTVAVLIGLLPLVHAHTFVVLMALLGGFWLETALRQHRAGNHWLLLMAVALTVALPQIAWQTLANASGTGGHWSPGWTIMPGESLPSFWAHNYGLTLLLVLGLPFIMAWRPQLRRYLAWYLPLLVVFVMANLYSLQPFAFDNLKLMLYTFLMAYLLVGYGALWLIRRNALALAPIGLAIILMSGSGTLAVAREFQHHDQFASIDDINVAAWVKDHTAPTDIFVTTDLPNQPVATLAGRSLVAGYRGWLYSYHLDYQPRLATVQQALVGDLTQANPYQATYLAVAAVEPAEWTVDTTALDANYQLLYRNSSWTVYKLPLR